MTENDFMDKWCDRNQERTVIVTDLFPDVEGLAIIVSFPPDRVAVGSIELYDDKPF